LYLADPGHSLSSLYPPPAAVASLPLDKLEMTHPSDAFCLLDKSEFDSLVAFVC